jgi:hypothetical protein
MRLHIVAFAGAAVSAIIAALPARADDCATLFSISLAQASMPHAMTMTMQDSHGPARTTKAVFTGTMMYTQVEGQWRSMPFTGAEIADQMREAAKTAKETCRRGADEAVNGTLASLYLAHVENRGTVSDNKIWISKSGGRVLKTDTAMKDGLHMIAVYDYTNVASPVGAKPLGAK